MFAREVVGQVSLFDGHFTSTPRQRYEIQLG